MQSQALLLSAALAGLMSAAMSCEAHASAAGGQPPVKCYGVVKAGQNSCANAGGSHSCAGQAKVDNDPGDWVMLAAAECAKDGGKNTYANPHGGTVINP